MGSEASGVVGESPSPPFLSLSRVTLLRAIFFGVYSRSRPRMAAVLPDFDLGSSLDS